MKRNWFEYSGRDVFSRLRSPASKSIFRSGDIRGQVNRVDASGLMEIDEYTIFAIASEYGLILRDRGVNRAVVGYDSRSYSFGLHNAAVLGILSSGIAVLDVGVGTTPYVQWVQRMEAGSASLMVTASHNPNGWAGLKMAPAPLETLSTEEFVRLQSGTKRARTMPAAAYEASDRTQAYIQDLVRRVSQQNPLKVVVDGGNGIGGPMLAAALELAGHEVIPINLPLDWSFPNHEPDPELLSARQQASHSVRDLAADCALLIDGDGDRLGVLDEQGRDLFADTILALFAQDTCNRRPGATIVYDVKCSQSVEEVIIAAGGTPVMAKTGHMNIKKAMRDYSAPFGGERSGHFFDLDRFIGTDDAIYSALWILEIFGKSSSSVSATLGELPSFSTTPTMHTHCPTEDTPAVLEAVETHFEQMGADINTLDGVRAKLKNGWVLVRPSNNMPELVIIAEARSADQLKSLYDELRRVLDGFPGVGTSWSNDPWGVAGEVSAEAG